MKVRNIQYSGTIDSCSTVSLSRRAHTASNRARLWLIFLPLTMVLPGGGLAVPVWVWMRLRWWQHLVAVRKTLVATN